MILIHRMVNELLIKQENQFLFFLGDLSDDLILMNELENIRHVSPNKVNNNSLGRRLIIRINDIYLLV
jgi:hypothetical protein